MNCQSLIFRQGIHYTRCEVKKRNCWSGSAHWRQILTREDIMLPSTHYDDDDLCRIDTMTGLHGHQNSDKNIQLCYERLEIHDVRSRCSNAYHTRVCTLPIAHCVCLSLIRQHFSGSCSCSCSSSIPQRRGSLLMPEFW